MQTFDATAHPVAAVYADIDMDRWLAGLGTVFAVFDLQDSGCVSYGVMTGSRRLFVKTSTTLAATESLHRALLFHAQVRHDSIVAPLAAYTFPGETVALIYPWRDRQVLYPTTLASSAIRTDPDGPMAAFRALPLPRIMAALATILDVHQAVIEAGFVAVDLYDGCLLYDFARHHMYLVDLDEYRPGPFTLGADRLPGSARFMAPEESRPGSVIDERTTVYNLGRTMRLLLDGGDAEQDWRGSSAQLQIIAGATDPDPARRHPSVAQLSQAWSSASPRPRHNAD